MARIIDVHGQPHDWRADAHDSRLQTLHSVPWETALSNCEEQDSVGEGGNREHHDQSSAPVSIFLYVSMTSSIFETCFLC